MYSMIQMCIISKAITNHKKLEEVMFQKRNIYICLFIVVAF